MQQMGEGEEESLPEQWLLLMQLPHNSTQWNMQHLLRLLRLLLLRVVTVYRLTVVCCHLWWLWRWRLRVRMRVCVLRMLASLRIALRWLMMMVKLMLMMMCCICCVCGMLHMIPLRLLLLLLLLSLQLHALLQVEHVLLLRCQLLLVVAATAGLIWCHVEVTLVLAYVSISRR